MCHVFMSVSRQYWLFIQMVELQVLYLTQEMVFHILYQFMRVMLSHMLYREFTLLEETSLIISKNFLMKGVIHSLLMQKLKLSRISKKECVSLLMIMMLQKKMLKTVIMLRKTMSYLMEGRSLLEKKGSRQQRFYSHHKKVDLTSRVSISIAMIQYLSVMSMLERTYS